MIFWIPKLQIITQTRERPRKLWEGKQIDSGLSWEKFSCPFFWPLYYYTHGGILLLLQLIFFFFCSAQGPTLCLFIFLLKRSVGCLSCLIALFCCAHFVFVVGRALVLIENTQTFKKLGFALFCYVRFIFTIFKCCSCGRGICMQTQASIKQRWGTSWVVFSFYIILTLMTIIEW